MGNALQALGGSLYIGVSGQKRCGHESAVKLLGGLTQCLGARACAAGFCIIPARPGFDHVLKRKPCRSRRCLAMQYSYGAAGAPVCWRGSFQLQPGVTHHAPKAEAVIVPAPSPDSPSDVAGLFFIMRDVGLLTCCIVQLSVRSQLRFQRNATSFCPQQWLRGLIGEHA